MPLSMAVVVGTLSNIRVSDIGISAKAMVNTPLGSVPIALMGKEMIEHARQYEGLPVLVTGKVRPWFSDRVHRWFIDIQIWNPDDIRVLSERPFANEQPTAQSRRLKPGMRSDAEKNVNSEPGDDDPPF